ncbi:hypothetical protein GF373_13585 [bacterium]|nr:hypothetical protein [bacterium]
MKQYYDASFVELREDTSFSYSQQVVDVIVDLLDNANLPVLMKVEAGNAAWSPSVSSGINAQIPGPWNADTTTLMPSFNGRDSLSSSIQYNDFSTAAMLRINSLYEFLCFPIQFADVNLPHGMLYTTISIQDSPKGLFLARKLSDGQYLGIPPEKKGEFLMFANDVIYWSQNANPNPQDLRSPAGLFYRFSVEYRDSLLNLAKAQKGLKTLKSDLESAKQTVNALQQEYQQTEEEAKAQQGDSKIIQTILSFKREDLLGSRNHMGQINDDILEAQTMIQTNHKNLTELIGLMEDTLITVEKNDPDFQGDIDSAIAMFEGHVEQAMQGEMDILQEVEGTDRRGTGLDAAESVDELYRERFESLPQRFEGAFQAQ